MLTTTLWVQKTTLKGLNVAVTAGSQDQINSLVAVLLLYGEIIWCHLMSDPTTSHTGNRTQTDRGALRRSLPIEPYGI